MMNCCQGQVAKLDQDSSRAVLAADAVTTLVRWFASPDVDAVAGQVKVSNRNTALTRLQNLEYLIGNTVYRRAQSLFGSVLLVPGPIAMYRVSALKEIVDGKWVVSKIRGDSEPADRMTKILGKRDIVKHLNRMNIKMFDGSGNLVMM